METDPHYGSVYDVLHDKEWKRKKGKIARLNEQSAERRIIVARERRIIDTEKKGDTHYPLAVMPRNFLSAKEQEPRYIKNITPLAEEKPKGRFAWFGKKKETYGERLKEVQTAENKKAKEAFLGAGHYTKKGFGIIWHNRGRAINRSIEAAQHGSEAMTNFGYALPGPFEIWTLAWQKMSKNLKLLIALVFFIVIMFVPWGVFYYTGWAVGAAFMFLVSLIYWVFANLFNGIAYVMVTAINGIATILISVLIWIVENILGFFIGTDTKSVPDPYNAGENIFVRGNYWVEGHHLLTHSLIKYSQISVIPELMKVDTPDWQPWMNNILIVKIIEHVPGVGGFVKTVDITNNAIIKIYRDFVTTADPVWVMYVCIFPIVVVFAVLLYVYYKNKHHLVD